MLSKMELAELKKGEQAKIVGFNACAKSYRHKLLAMGLTRGALLQVVRIAPLGDPIEIKIRGFHLSLRKGEAKALCLERADT